MRIGFTGTQKGMTEHQFDVFVNVIHTLMRQDGDGSVFHHGDCVGCDQQAHQIVAALRGDCNYDIKFDIHPPSDPKSRAFCKGKDTDTVRHPAPYLVRNHSIVDEVDFLIGCPKGAKEVLRSGTWATVRYARESSKKIMLIFPDGSQVLTKGDGS